MPTPLTPSFLITEFENIQTYITQSMWSLFRKIKIY